MRGSSKFQRVGKRFLATKLAHALTPRAVKTKKKWLAKASRDLKKQARWSQHAPDIKVNAKAPFQHQKTTPKHPKVGKTLRTSYKNQ